MCQPIAGLDALHLLGSAIFLGDQMVKLAMRTSKDEFDTGLLAQVACIYAGLSG